MEIQLKITTFKSHLCNTLVFNPGIMSKVCSKSLYLWMWIIVMPTVSSEELRKVICAKTDKIVSCKSSSFVNSFFNENWVFVKYSPCLPEVSLSIFHYHNQIAIQNY